MSSRDIQSKYKIRQNRPVGINTTDIPFRCLVLISFNKMNVYRDRDVHGDMSVIEYIGSGSIKLGDQTESIGNNRSLNNWNDYIILLRCPSPGKYKSYGYYLKVGDTWIERHDGRNVFVSRLVRVGF